MAFPKLAFVFLALAALLLFYGCAGVPSSPSLPSSLQLPLSPSALANPSSPSAPTPPSAAPAPLHPWQPAPAAAAPPSGVPIFPSAKNGSPSIPAPDVAPIDNGSQYGYKGGVPFGEITFPHNYSVDDPTASIPGSWRVYSSRIFYDICGAGGMTGAGSSESLNLDSSGSWTYGGSSGTWSVSPITAADWTKWKVKSYGPTYKIVLDNWNGVGADGPIEASGPTANFLWVIYHVQPPLVQRAGNVQTKFGH